MAKTQTISEKIADIRRRFKERQAVQNLERMRRERERANFREPRYDDVFFEGTEYLNSL